MSSHWEWYELRLEGCAAGSHKDEELGRMTCVLLSDHHIPLKTRVDRASQPHKHGYMNMYLQLWM